MTMTSVHVYGKLTNNVKVLRPGQASAQFVNNPKAQQLVQKLESVLDMAAKGQISALAMVSIDAERETRIDRIAINTEWESLLDEGVFGLLK